MSPARLGYFCEPAVAPRRALAVQSCLLDGIRSGRLPPMLYVYGLCEPVAAPGCFHVLPENGGPFLRRLSGGRVVPMGPGIVAASLLLPQRDALLDAEPGSLTASQLLNRYVRGLLHGCRAAGADPSYPGRDLVTCDGRVLAALSLNVEDSGAALFELTIAANRTFDVLPAILDRSDPDGVLLAPMIASDQAVALSDCLQRPYDAEQVTALLAHGYADYFGCEVAGMALSGDDEAAIDELASEAWLIQRTRDAALSFKGTAWGQLGAVEVYYSEAAGVLREVRISGDFIANAPALHAVERSLGGVPRTTDAILAVIREIFDRPSNFLLGLGDGKPIADAICAGAAW